MKEIGGFIELMCLKFFRQNGYLIKKSENAFSAEKG
jgi:hypothetical protein